jgi:hypothetical protein
MRQRSAIRSGIWLRPEMTERSFSLVPFAQGKPLNVSISGTFSRDGTMLYVQYLLAGDLWEIVMPAPAIKPCREDELWKRTCFEFFLAKDSQPEYWEVNLSPSGDWNVYKMDAYRRVGFQTEPLVHGVAITTQSKPDVFTLTAAVDLDRLLQIEESVIVAIAAVLQTRDGRETYWALTHPASQADFHLRESFILALEGQTRLSPRSAPGD